MTEKLAVLDTDMLSDFSRGNPKVAARARDYLRHHGRLTFTAITVFERIRGYRLALVKGKSFEEPLARFEALVAASRILPFDESAADHAGRIWAALSHKQQHALGDILIAGIASARGLPLVTRNRKDFEPISKIAGVSLELVDWSR
jgi:predicted nucleic acid-binding protein